MPVIADDFTLPEEEEEENVFDATEAPTPARLRFRGQLTFGVSKRAILKATARLDPNLLKRTGTNWFELGVVKFAYGLGDRAVAILDWNAEINQYKSERSAIEHSLIRKIYRLMRNPAHNGRAATDGIAVWGVQVYVDYEEVKS